MAIHPLLCEGRTPPKGLALHSRSLQDWYDEQLYYCWEGRTIQLDGGRSYHMTGDHYWYNNFTPIQTFYADKLDPNRTIVDFTFPLWSQEDDWVMKQFHEAYKADKMGSMLFTARGYGKTYMVVSIGLKYYYLEVGSHCLLSAAIDDHARPTFEKTEKVMGQLEKNHPLLALKRLNTNEDIIQAGQKQLTAGVWTDEVTSQMEKIVWGNSPGKAKGRRLAVHHWEEVGDHSCPAKLSDCYTASKGSWQVGGVKTCRTFYTGTGGTIKSDQASEMFFNPLAYNIYPVELYQGRKLSMLIDGYRDERTEKGKHAIFLTAISKRGKYWEEDRIDPETGAVLFEAGESDEEGALEDVLLEREAAKEQPDVYNKLVQEFPLTMDEMFRQGGNGEFDRDALGIQKQKLNAGKLHMPGFPDKKKPDRGRLEWVFKNGRKVGVEWQPGMIDGKHEVYIVEHPPMDEKGQLIPMKDAYIAGIDSIDQGVKDSVSGAKRGSKFGMLVKKRQAGIQKVSNLYVCLYLERPDDPDDAFDMSLRILWYYSAHTNFEYTKLAIKPYYRNQRPSEYWRFVLRPKIGNASADPHTQGDLIGTLMTDPVLSYGLKRIKQHIRECIGNILFPQLVQQLIDYTLAEKTKYDLVVAMIMCEIADEDMADRVPTVVKPPQHIDMPVYYEDENGHMQYGVPEGLPVERLTPNAPGTNMGRQYAYSDQESNRRYYLDGTYD